MKAKWQLPLVLRLHRAPSTLWLGIEWRSPRYQPRTAEWDMADLSGMLKSYDD